MYLSIYLSTQGYKNKMESRELSTIYEWAAPLSKTVGPSSLLSVKINTPLLLVYTQVTPIYHDKLAIGVRNFSTKLSVNNLKINEEFFF